MTPEPMRLCLVRHGETAWNAEQRLQGHKDLPLSPEGLQQAAQAARQFVGQNAAALYSSDLQRAYATAEAVARTTGAPLTPVPGLRERSFGSFQGRTFQQIETESPEQALRWRKRDPHFVPDGGGESLDMLRERIAVTVEGIAARHTGEQIVLVAHGGVMDVLYRLATRLDLQAPRT